MKLISLRISNLGPFFGEQNIQFATKDGAPINVVVGPNGSGKTTLLTAIGWALYGVKYLSRYRQLAANLEATKRGIHNASVELTFQHLGRRYLLTRLLNKSEQVELRSSEASFSVFDVTDKAVALLVPNAQDFVGSILPIELGSLIFADAEQIPAMRDTNDGDLSPIGRAIRSLFGPTLDTNLDVKGEMEGKHYPTEDEILKIIEIAVNDWFRAAYGGKYSIDFNNSGNFGVFENGRAVGLGAGSVYVISLVTHCLSLTTILELLVQYGYFQDQGTDSFPIVLESPFSRLDASHKHVALNILTKLNRPLILMLHPQDLESLVECNGLCEKVGGLHALVLHEPAQRNFGVTGFDFRGVHVPLLVEGSGFEGAEIKTIAICESTNSVLEGLRQQVGGTSRNNPLQMHTGPCQTHE
jgi:hypothetical protein